MDKKEQLNSDKKVLASLEAEYKRAQRVIYSIRALVTDLNFEELIPDSQERCLMVDELQAYDYIRTNLMNRIRLYRARVKREESIKDWSQYKKTDSIYIGVDVSNEGDHGACCQVCGDAIATVQDPNESQPADTRVSLKDLLGMEVMFVFPHCHKCGDCTFRKGADGSECPCVKVELVGGDYICLAKRPVVTGLDDSQKYWEEVYRENMELLRRYTIEQSEANQRLIKAMKKAYEKEERPVISFDEEENEGLGDIMQEIKEKAEDFMNYLDSVVNG